MALKPETNVKEAARDSVKPRFVSQGMPFVPVNGLTKTDSNRLQTRHSLLIYLDPISYRRPNRLSSWKNGQVKCFAQSWPILDHHFISLMRIEKDIKSLKSSLCHQMTGTQQNRIWVFNTLKVMLGKHDRFAFRNALKASLLDTNSITR